MQYVLAIDIMTKKNKYTIIIVRPTRIAQTQYISLIWFSMIFQSTMSNLIQNFNMDVQFTSASNNNNKQIQKTLLHPGILY